MRCYTNNSLLKKGFITIHHYAVKEIRLINSAKFIMSASGRNHPAGHFMLTRYLHKLRRGDIGRYHLVRTNKLYNK
jgi:hypothetical protein